MPSRDQIRNQIMLTLDRQTCHGYELRRLLAPMIGDVEITKLYRVLKEMEKEGLIESIKEKGPHGPARKVYRIGPRGEKQLRVILRDAMGVVLHFYDEFRHFMFQEQMKDTEPVEIEVPEGRILVTIMSPFMIRKTGAIMILESWGEKKPLHVMGDTGIWDQKRVPFVNVEGLPWDVKSKSSWFSEYWILGTPHRNVLPRTIMEAKRILKPGGNLRVVAPFAFFNDPDSVNIESFVRLTATHQFPELGVVEGPEICSVFQQMFKESGTMRILHDYVEFWGQKENVS